MRVSRTTRKVGSGHTDVTRAAKNAAPFPAQQVVTSYGYGWPITDYQGAGLSTIGLGVPAAAVP